MRRLFLISLSLFLLAGCATKPSRQGILSQDLPLTLDDLSEIRAGEKNHERVMWQYQPYQNPFLEKYLNSLAANLAEVSTRPHLPYRVILLDSDEVNVFGGPGGFIYVTRGVLNFVESEPEIAGILAHEITHVANYEYADIPHISKVKKTYDVVLKGTEFAQSAPGIGGYFSGANQGLKTVGRAAPAIARRYGKDQEIETDIRAVDTLIKAGYDPRGYLKFVDKLTKIKMEEVGRFVMFMNTHPPFQERRQVLEKRIRQMALESGKIEFKPDSLIEFRQKTEEKKPDDSILFQPQLHVKY